MRSAILLILCAAAVAAQRQVAVTFDDLPIAQSGRGGCEFQTAKEITKGLLAAFRMPITAFVIGANCSGLSVQQKREILRMWMAGGAEMANHTYSHRGLNSTPIEEYEKDILRGDETLRELLGVKPRFFRWPMLQAGPDKATKERLERFLAAQGYREAPVTYDNSDWMFAYVYALATEGGDTALAARARAEYVPYMESVIAFFELRSVEVAGREFPQVLLLHANRLNADAGAELVAMLKRRGYSFVTLESALKDEAYKLPNDYAGKGGFSWIHRWSMTKGMKLKGAEPDEPEWLTEAYKKFSSQ